MHWTGTNLYYKWGKEFTKEINGASKIELEITEDFRAPWNNVNMQTGNRKYGLTGPH